MACHSCLCENVIPPARACVNCIEKSRLDLIEECKKSMEMLNRHLVFCDTQKEYIDNRNSYNYYRLQILYETNEIPKPKRRNKTQREKSNIF